MNCPDNKLILLKSMHVKYLKIAKGHMQAAAYCTEEMAAKIAREERGNLIVPVIVTDESEAKPIEVEMIWAWLPKKGKNNVSFF